MKNKNEKIILVDAYHCLFDENGINTEMQEILDLFPNRKIVLTNANDEQIIEFGIDKSPYEVFTLKHNPNKNEGRYYEKMLDYFGLEAENCIYIEHSKESVKQAEALEIKTFHYTDESIKLLEEFIRENI